MKSVKQFIAWFMQRATTIVLVAFAILLIFTFISNKINRKKEIELVRQNTTLTTKNNILTEDNSILDISVDSLRSENDYLKELLSASEVAREANAKEKARIANERDRLMDSLRNIASNDLYKRFNELFPFPGDRKYSINIKQIGEVIYVTLDYSLVKKENAILTKDIQDCNSQLALGDSIRANMEKIIEKKNLQEENDSNIILNLKDQNELSLDEIQRLKRKLLWTKIGSGVILVGTVVLLL